MENELLKWQVLAPQKKLRHDVIVFLVILILYSIFALLILYRLSYNWQDKIFWGVIFWWVILIFCYFVVWSWAKKEVLLEYLITTQAVSFRSLVVEKSGWFWAKYNVLSKIVVGYEKFLASFYFKAWAGGNMFYQPYEAVECFRIKDDRLIILRPKNIGRLYDFEIIAQDKEQLAKIIVILKDYLPECRN